MKNSFPISAIAISLCLAVLSSCSNADAPDTPDTSSGIPITFSALTRWDEPSAEQAKASAYQGKTTASQAKEATGQPFQATTRLADAADGNATSFTSGDAIGLFAYHNTNATPDFMNNQRVTFDGASWTYSPTKYWPRTDGDRLSFYAYYPYNSEKITVISTTGTPSFKYDAKKADTDILAATSLGLSSSTNNGVVPLSFVHLLAKVKFTFTSSFKENHPVVHALKYDIPCEGTCKFTSPLKFDDVSDVKSTLLRFVSKSEGVVINEPNIAIDEFTAYILPCDISEFLVSINNVFVSYKPIQAVTVKAGYQYTINFVISGDDNSSFFITSYSLWETDSTIHEGELK